VISFVLEFSCNFSLTAHGTCFIDLEVIDNPREFIISCNFNLTAHGTCFINLKVKDINVFEE
jgi:hypothetical protein